MTLAHFWDGGFGMNWPGPFEIIFGIAGFLFWVGFWVLIAILIVNLFRRGGVRSSSALGVLEERYARGEISRDEFFERKAVLEGRGSPAT
jgi:putative membrane protein